MPRSPEIFDPYVGKVYGNILDQYDNPTYNIKISVIRQTDVAGPVSSNTSTSSAETGAGARETTSAPTAMPGTSVVNNYLGTPAPAGPKPPLSAGASATPPPAPPPTPFSPLIGEPLKFIQVGNRSVPVAGSGTFDENMNALNSYILSYKNGIRTGENSRAGGTDKDAHSGLGHNDYDSAFDVNVSYGLGGDTSVSFTEAAQLDPLAAALRQAGYKPLWRQDGHYNHLHVEIPQEYKDTQPGWTRDGVPIKPGEGNADAPAGTTDSATETSWGVIDPVPDNQQIIIAQTGVTAVTIDDLEINFFVESDRNFVSNAIKFTLTQPGAANLLDQIKIARAYLGAENVNEFYFLVEVSFVGYDSSIEDNAARGEPTLIAGPFGFRCKSAKVLTSVTPAGSTYTFDGVLAGTVAGSGLIDGYNDVVFRVPAQFSTSGSTITEHAMNLQENLNNYLRKNSTAYTRPDQYKFDLSGLLASAPGREKLLVSDKIKDETVTTNNDPSAEKTGVDQNQQSRLQEAEDAQEENRLTKKIRGTSTEQLNNSGKLYVSEGTTLTDYFAKLLNMNDEFRSKISSLKNINNPALGIDTTKLSTSWFTIEVETMLGAYDRRRGDYTKTYMIRPIIYKTPRPDIQRLSIAESGSEDVIVSELAANALLEEIIGAGALYKSYSYMFTGLNDQILDFSIDFDSTAAVIASPRSGYVGDTSVINAVALNPTLPATASTDIFGVMDIVNSGRNALTVLNYINTLSASAQAQAASALGQTEAQLKSILQIGGVAAARALAAQIDAVTLAKVARSFVPASGDSASAPTSGGVGTNFDGTPYTPESSGRVYAEDLLNLKNLGSITYDQIANLGFPGLAGKDSDEIFGMQQKVIGTQTNSSVGESSTYSGDGIGNTLFSYVYQQSQTRNFLNKVDLRLRGDPWYLGRAPWKSTPDQLKLKSDSMTYMLLTIASPLAYDFNLADEDSNSGYWNMNGMSQSFSGLYFIQSVSNKFSGGAFTSEVEAVKNYGVPLYKIRPLKPGEAPENYIRNGKDISKNPREYIYGIPDDKATGETSGGAVGLPGKNPVGSMTPEEEAKNWKALEDRERQNRLAAGLDPTFSDAERRAINGILASEGGDPAHNLAVLLNRSYQEKTPVNTIVFGLNQFSPVNSALGIYNDSYGSREAHINGGQKFIGGFNSNATSNLTTAINGYSVPLSKGYNFFNAESLGTKYDNGTVPSVTLAYQTYYKGDSGGFGRAGEQREAEFYRLNNINDPDG